MIRRSSVTLLAGLALISGPASFAQEKEMVEQIVAKVAENQDRSQEMRTAFVYHQDLLLRFKRGNGKIARAESREYTVTPTSKGSQKTLTHFLGKYEKDGKLIEYKEPGYTYQDLDIDGELIDDLANDLANEKESRDGIAAKLFFADNPAAEQVCLFPPRHRGLWREKRLQDHLPAAGQQLVRRRRNTLGRRDSGRHEGLPAGLYQHPPCPRIAGSCQNTPGHESEGAWIQAHL